MIKNETHRKNIQKLARSNRVGTRNLLELLERGFDLTLLGTAFKGEIPNAAQQVADIVF